MNHEKDSFRASQQGPLGETSSANDLDISAIRGREGKALLAPALIPLAKFNKAMIQDGLNRTRQQTGTRYDRELFIVELRGISNFSSGQNWIEARLSSFPHEQARHMESRASLDQLKYICRPSRPAPETFGYRPRQGQFGGQYRGQSGYRGRGRYQTPNPY